MELRLSGLHGVAIVRSTNGDTIIVTYSELI